MQWQQNIESLARKKTQKNRKPVRNYHFITGGIPPSPCSIAKEWFTLLEAEFTIKGSCTTNMLQKEWLSKRPEATSMYCWQTKSLQQLGLLLTELGVRLDGFNLQKWTRTNYGCRIHTCRSFLGEATQCFLSLKNKSKHLEAVYTTIYTSSKKLLWQIQNKGPMRTLAHKPEIENGWTMWFLPEQEVIQENFEV